MLRRLIAAHLAVAAAAAAFAQTDAPPPLRDPAAMFAKADANKDSVIVLEEWLAIGRREMGFKLMDADGNGKMTQAEFAAGLAKFRAYAKPR